LKQTETTVPGKLDVFVGTWAGTERLASSRTGLAGIATGIVSSRLELGGRALIQDYMQRCNGRNSRLVHAVITVGEYENQLRLFWFDDSGVPPRPAPGFWIGGRLFFIRATARGKVRHVYTPTSDHSYSYRMESSLDDGQTWQLTMQAEYLRSQP
jgi:hypothetical protein